MTQNTQQAAVNQCAPDMPQEALSVGGSRHIWQGAVLMGTMLRKGRAEQASLATAWLAAEHTH